MRLSPEALAATAAIFLGGSTLLIGAANLLEPSYGADHLRSISSVYPGFEASRTLESVLIGTAYPAFPTYAVKLCDVTSDMSGSRA